MHSPSTDFAAFAFLVARWSVGCPLPLVVARSGLADVQSSALLHCHADGDTVALALALAAQPAADLLRTIYNT
jgi:hypothetical protein